MQTLDNFVRAKVDQIRNAGSSADRARLLDELGKVAVTGGNRTERGAIHMCPWHTCQATRHG